MGDNNKQEAADLAALHNDGDNIFEVIYRGGPLDTDYHWYTEEDFQHNPHPPHYTVPDEVNIHLVIHSSVMVINSHACMNCVMLREVVFHNKNTITIGQDAFQYFLTCCHVLSYSKDSSGWNMEPFLIVHPSKKL